MNIATTAARLVLGVGFLFAGASAFFISSPPPEPGLAGVFNDVFFKSHWRSSLPPHSSLSACSCCSTVSSRSP